MGSLVASATGLYIALGAVLLAVMTDRRRRGLITEAQFKRGVYGYAALGAAVVFLDLVDIRRLLSAH
jgi:hypothetical protein